MLPPIVRFIVNGEGSSQGTQWFFDRSFVPIGGGVFNIALLPFSPLNHE